MSISHDRSGNNISDKTISADNMIGFGKEETDKTIQSDFFDIPETEDMFPVEPIHKEVHAYKKKKKHPRIQAVINVITNPPSIFGVLLGIILAGLVLANIILVGSHFGLRVLTIILSVILTLAVTAVYVFAEKRFDRNVYGSALAVSYHISCFVFLFIAEKSASLFSSISILQLENDFSVSDLAKLCFLTSLSIVCLVLIVRIVFEILDFVRETAK